MEISVIRDIVAIFGVIAGFSYYVLTVRATRKNQELQLETRQAQLFTQFMFQLFTTDSIKEYFEVFEMQWDSYEDYWRKYGLPTNPDAVAYTTRLRENLNILGTYVRNDLISIELVNEAIGGVLIRMWPKWRDIIEYERANFYTPNYARDFEYLYNEILKLREKTGQGIDMTLGRNDPVPDSNS